MEVGRREAGLVILDVGNVVIIKDVPQMTARDAMWRAPANGQARRTALENLFIVSYCFRFREKNRN